MLQCVCVCELLLLCVLYCCCVRGGATCRPDMTKEECQAFVKKMLAHAMARDGSSGGVIRTVTITEDEVVRDFTSGADLPFSI